MIIDEATLDRIDRLGLAYCRLNRFEWDEILGPKPDGFDDLPAYPPKRKHSTRHGSQPISKSDYVEAAIWAIRSIIGEANCSRCVWVLGLGKTEAEWLQWYLNERFRYRV